MDSLEINAVAALRAALSNDWPEAKRVLEPHSNDFDELSHLADIFHSLENLADDMAARHYTKGVTP